MKSISLTTFATAILLFAITCSLFTISPQTVAQTTYTNMQDAGSIPLPPNVTPDVRVATIACLSFRPNTVGIGQTILVNIWTLPAIHAARYISDYTVTITKPDGVQEVIKKDSYRADATSWFEYTPDQIGAYKLKFDFLGAYWPAGNYSVEPGAWIGGQVVNFQKSVYHEPSSSPELTLTVQENAVTPWSASALPTDYWTRPIAVTNREWWIIGGWYPWSGVGGGSEWDELYPRTSPYWGPRQRFTPWVQAPDSPHVAWKRQTVLSGLFGGDMKDYSSTSSAGSPSIIYGGRAYQSITKVFNGNTTNVWECYDLRTGEIIWEKTDIPTNERPTYVSYTEGVAEVPGGDPAFGMSAVLVNVNGGYVRHYNPSTGELLTSVSIAPLTTGTLYSSSGSDYYISVQNLGNSSPIENRYRLIDWTIQIDPTSSGRRSYTFSVLNNVTWPWSSVPDADYNTKIAVSVSDIHAEQGARTSRRVIAADMTTGTILWNKTFEETYYQNSHALCDHGKLAMSTIDGEFVALDLKTGNQVWRSETMDYPWDLSFGAYSISSAYGYIFSARYSGVYAIDWDTGKIVWKYEDLAEVSFETPYVNANGSSAYPFFTGSWVADGKIYIHNTEHTETQPLTRGWGLHCINATTGDRIWKVGIRGSVGAVADGYISVAGTDGVQYIFGKGKTQTTLSAPSTCKLTENFTITGTVIDLSPAQFGTPAISEKDMSKWMEYLHQQQPKPIDVQGVTVQLTAIDPNNNWITIGQATSDSNGVFGYSWIPEVPGLYKIVVIYPGSQSYGSSSATTYLTAVEKESPQATTLPIENQSLADMYFVPLAVGMILAIIVTAITIVLLLRKR